MLAVSDMKMRYNYLISQLQTEAPKIERVKSQLLNDIKGLEVRKADLEGEVNGLRQELEKLQTREAELIEDVKGSEVRSTLPLCLTSSNMPFLAILTSTKSIPSKLLARLFKASILASLTMLACSNG